MIVNISKKTSVSTSDKWRKARRRDLSASRPAEAGPGQERRARLKDPAAAGEGRHSLWPGESSTETGEERQEDSQLSKKKFSLLGQETRQLTFSCNIENWIDAELINKIRTCCFSTQEIKPVNVK